MSWSHCPRYHRIPVLDRSHGPPIMESGPHPNARCPPQSYLESRGKSMQIHADLYVHKSLYLVHTSMYPFCTSSPHRVLKMQLCAKVIKVCVWVSAPATLWTSKWEKECTCKCYYQVYVCVWAWSIQRSCLHERRNFCMKEVTSPQ